MTSRSSLILIIKYLIHQLNTSHKSINFLWIPSYVGISCNETADQFITSIKTFFTPSPLKIPSLEFLPIHHMIRKKALLSFWYRLISDIQSQSQTILGFRITICLQSCYNFFLPPSFRSQSSPVLIKILYLYYNIDYVFLIYFIFVII